MRFSEHQASSLFLKAVHEVYHLYTVHVAFEPLGQQRVGVGRETKANRARPCRLVQSGAWGATSILNHQIFECTSSQCKRVSVANFLFKNNGQSNTLLSGLARCMIVRPKDCTTSLKLSVLQNLSQSKQVGRTFLRLFSL